MKKINYASIAREISESTALHLYMVDSIAKALSPIKAARYSGKTDLIEFLIQQSKENPEFVDLSGGQIGRLPREIKLLKKARILDLSRNEIEELPMELFELSNLEVLSLAGNRLTEIPSDFKKLANLRILDLSSDSEFFVEYELEDEKKENDQRKLDCFFHQNHSYCH